MRLENMQGLKLGKTPSNSFRPLKSDENFWQHLELCSLRVSFALDGSWNFGAILVSRDNLFCFNAIPGDGIFDIDMHNHLSNEHSIYTCNKKKSKRKLDSTFLWHCRLVYINKKRITKLQHDGLFKSINDESFDVCVSCISGKMARNPFTHAGKRANELLVLIHSDVYGLFKTTSREESVARILNMVPIKKVDKTPYEIWHWKVLNQSYLKVLGCEALGYPKETMGSYFYYPPENKIFFARQDAQTSENTSEHHPEAKHEDVKPQGKEHKLRDHDEPTNNRAALSDPKTDKWLKVMNAEMQSMKDNQV
ncbi:zinc finger, CCHC-type containing protein [Tanacetum coccineum]